jgi:hypothetical protein
MFSLPTARIPFPELVCNLITADIISLDDPVRPFLILLCDFEIYFPDSCLFTGH